MRYDYITEGGKTVTQYTVPEAAKHKAWRQRLLADDPDIDEQTLADTLEGLTDLSDMLRATVRAALDDEDHVTRLKLRIEVLKARLHRFETRADRRRRTVAALMDDCGVKKLVAEDFTASVVARAPGLTIVDEADIPQEYFRMVPQLDKGRLKQALKDGAAIPGANLGNAWSSLTVRTT